MDGVRKLWEAAPRAGIDIGRDQVARLMKLLSIEGVCREKRVKTTKLDPAAPRHPDLVNRVFHVNTLNQLWVTDLTFVPTWQGVAYVCFMIDAFSRMIAGWRCASNMKTQTVGTVGDSDDNALAETVNGYDKAELARGPAKQGPWKTIDDLELATLEWVHWHNTHRLHGYLGDMPPTEFEESFYAGVTISKELEHIK